MVRIQGVVLDQGLGEYVVVQDETGSIRAETRQTTPLGGGESVTAQGRLYWDGTQLLLRHAVVLPAAWNASSELKITPAPGKPAQLPVLHQVQQIRALPAAEAAWNYPVKVIGVITTIRKDFKAIYVQDATAGIFVSVQTLGFNDNWKVGERVEVEGISGPGGYAPIIVARSVKVAGRGKMPEARHVTLYQLATGLFDSQWVEVRGIVRSAHAGRRMNVLELSDINGLVTVQLPTSQPMTNLVDSLVSIRGVGVSRANRDRQLINAYISSPSTNFVTVEEPGVADPFTLPTRPISSLSQFDQWRANQHRVKIAGVVTFSEPGGPMFVQDDSGGVPVYLAHPSHFKPGDRLEVAGYLSPGDIGNEFRNAECRRVGRQDIPAPRTVTSVRLLDQSLNGQWVVLKARLVSCSHNANEDVLTLQANRSIFEAIHPNHSGSDDWNMPAGTLLQLHGVYSILGDESRMPGALRLYLPADEPIQILDKPEWWSTRHTLTVLGIMFIVLLAAALWAITLRRRVGEQTLIIRERLEREAALQQRYRDIFEGANDLIFAHDLQGRLTSLNPAAQRALGYTTEEATHLSINKVVAASHRDLVRRLGEARDGNGPVTTCELALVAKDGHQVLVEASTRVILKDGRPAGLQAIARDITERKRAEDALRESEAHYRQLVEQSPIAIFIESDGRFAFINQAGLRLLGATAPEEIIGRSVLDVVHPDDRPTVQGRIGRLREDRKPVPALEERYLRLDGSVVLVEVAATPILFGNTLAAQVIVHDMTARKQAEEELFNSRQMLRTVLDTIPQRVFWKDRNSVFLGCNKPLAEDCGLADSNAVIGKTDYDIMAAELAEAYRADDQHVMKTGVARYNYEEPQIRPDGTQRWLKSSKVPLFDKEGKVSGLLGTYEDVTDRNQAEAALAQASALLEAMLENSPDCIYFKDVQSRFVRCSKSLAKMFHVDEPARLHGKSDFDFFMEEHARQAFLDEQEIMRTGQPMVGKPEKEIHSDGRTTWALTTKMAWRDKDGHIIGTFGISKDVTAIKTAEEQLAQERELFRALVDHLPDNIYFKDLNSRFVRVSRSKAESTLLSAREKYATEHPGDTSKEWPAHLASVDAFAMYLIGKTDFDTSDEEHARRSFEGEQSIIRTGIPLIGQLEKMTLPDGSTRWMLITKMPWRDPDGKTRGTFGVSRDITALKEAEARLETAHQRLVETSRLAGMAEVATDVLHNVGNVLNSVNVSCSLAIDVVKTSRLASLSKVSELLVENRGHLGKFLTEDSRGQQIPDYLAVLAQHLAGEQASLLKELEQLVKHVDHIKQIVAMQQSYAKVAGVLEPVNPTRLVQDALHINAAALSRHDVEVRCEFEKISPILTEKHKVLQILVNLIRNAKYALDEAKRPDRLLTIKVANDGTDGVKIQVIDNGIGIPTENLTRIFSHGFTTRRNGHGFGLHSSALAVRELGGSLQGHSDGPGTGAAFTLVLPHRPPSHPEQPV